MSVPHSDAFVFFGATGDLAYKQIFPALQAMIKRGRLDVPVIGAGIALNQGASAPNTVLGFAILVALGVSVSGWALVGRRPRTSDQAA